jgi:hypothetical protein
VMSVLQVLVIVLLPLQNFMNALSSWVSLHTASQDLMSFAVNTDRQFHRFYTTARCTFLCKW